jgi:osmotically-inducible protein OsmY
MKNSTTGNVLFSPPQRHIQMEPSLIEEPLDERIISALENNPYLNRRNLRFETHEGRVILRGEVSTFFQKQMAQESLRQVEGIDEIANELEVTWA